MQREVPETGAPRGPRVLLTALVAIVALVGVVLLLMRTLSQRPAEQQGVLAAPSDSDERFGEVKPFELVDQAGRTVTLDTLRGRPWIAAFTFTRCTGPCPSIYANMRHLQDDLAGSDVRLVSFSVDPLHDTPEVLARHAEALGADTARWWFLTGDLEALRRVSFQSFLLPFERDETQPVGQIVTHKTLLTVVDRSGAIRGYYDGQTADGAALARERALHVARER
jgi:cytochrome oxidase Cu insertion factor (SCO1/SenC/PrrC family)